MPAHVRGEIGQLVVERDFLAKGEPVKAPLVQAHWRADGEHGPEARDDRSTAHGAVDYPAMRVDRDQPVSMVWPGQDGDPVELGIDEDHRCPVHGNAVLWQPPDGKAPAQAGLLRRAQTDPPADGHDGPTGRLSATEDYGAPPGTPQVFLSAQGPGDHAPEPRLVRRHYLRPDAARVPLPGCDHGLGHAAGPVLAPFEHDGHRVLPLSADLLCKSPAGQ